MSNINYNVHLIIIPTVENLALDQAYGQTLQNMSEWLCQAMQGETLLACLARCECLDAGQVVYELANNLYALESIECSFMKFVYFDRGIGPNQTSENHDFVRNLKITYLQHYYVLSSSNSFSERKKEDSQQLIESLRISMEDIGNIVLIGDKSIYELLDGHVEWSRFNNLWTGVLKNGPNELQQPPPLVYQQAHMDEYIKLDDEEGLCNNLRDYLKKKPISAILSYKDQQLEQITNSLEEFRHQLDSVENIVKGLTTRNQISSEVSESALNKIEAQSKQAREQIEDCSEIINYALDMKNTFADPCNQRPQETYIKIKKFHYSKEHNHFRLQIENPTDHEFYNVTVFILETGHLLCHFSLIEPHTKLWKEMERGYSDDNYGFHLIAVCQNQIVIEEPFFIYRCKLKVISRGEINTDSKDLVSIEYEITLKNYCEEEIQDVYLNVPDSVKGIELDWKSGFSDEEILEQKFTACYLQDSIADHYMIFATSKNSVISNSIILEREIIRLNSY